MKKIIFLLLVIPLVSACHHLDGVAYEKPQPSSICLGPPHSLPEVTGYTATAIAYGDSYLVVLPLSEIREHTEFRFILGHIPLSGFDAQYQDAWVSITGENETTSTAAPWLTASGQLTSTGPTIVTCVPTVTVGHTYKYKVTIGNGVDLDKDGLIDPGFPNAGGQFEAYSFIDPRADVIP